MKTVDDLVAAALAPQRSVVVEACAGSGKTWLLVARILRLLLEGSAPGEILAITFTRKAAREIEQRLFEWLRLLAVGSDAEVRDFLAERAVPPAQTYVYRARGLYERVLAAQPPLTVSTFHGWFARLLQGAPLSSDLPGFALHESGNRLMEEVWQLFAAERARSDDAATASLLWLLRHAGDKATRKLLFGLAARRAEWHAFAGEGPHAPARALAALRACLGVEEAPAAIERLLADDLFLRKLREYAGLLRRSDLDTDRQIADRLEGLARASDEAARFDCIAAALLTKEGTPRQRKSVKKDQERFAADAARFAELHAWLGERVAQTCAARSEELAYALNVHVFTAGAAWLEALERHKRARRLMDFTDLEWHVSRMLAVEAQAAFLQARLDARYRHILLDEFQDTNTLQWRILLSWLAAYGADEAARPCVFVVGDPKQSIYRFRRAEPRVFDAAASFLQAKYRARQLTQDTSRRNAQPIIDVVNHVFDGLRQFPHFRWHSSAAASLPGRVELLPLCAREETAEKTGCEGIADWPLCAREETAPPPAPRLRDPLVQPQAVAEDGRRRAEAALLAGRVAEIVGRWPVIDKESKKARPARYGDIMVLTRRRAVLPAFEQALRAAAIPYHSVGRGGLLRTLEADDLTALLRCLVTTADDLTLAHALRAPVLGAADEDLLQLAQRGEGNWWQRLQALAAAGEASAALERAARLLEGWRQAAARLPVHDLLDRIYHEGDLPARYRASVPAALWPGVAANLEAYIALALRLDAGRYPSLPRFLDELARLGEAADEEAPDEGTIPSEAAGDRMRLLTIHGAKGLEAPIVWLVDAGATQQPTEAWSLLLDWPPEAERPAHLSLLGRKDECGARRAALMQAEADFAGREELNLLYVALTRARQYFFASGIASERRSAKTSFWERIAVALDTLRAPGGVYGETPDPLAASPTSPSAEPTPPAPPAVSAGRRREAASAAMTYGSKLHAALDALSAGAAGERPPAAIASEEWPAFQAAARAVLAAPRLRPFFDPASHLRAHNEIEFALPDGSVGRIDRLVELPEAWWALDYKSGRPDDGLLESYRAQMAHYRAALTAIFPGKPVRCGLVFGNGELMEI